MDSETLSKPKKVSQSDYDVISNRIISVLAQRESLIKSWSASSPQPALPQKTQAQLDAEDAALFKIHPPHLGIGAPIPAEFLVSQAERTTKSLRAKLFISNSLRASKARDAEEKAVSAKRGLRNDSSDEEEGRTSLGRKKKTKVDKNSKENNQLASKSIECLKIDKVMDQSSKVKVLEPTNDAKGSTETTNPNSKLLSPLDSEEKRRMKRRDKKKRQKLKSAIASVTNNQKFKPGET